MTGEGKRVNAEELTQFSARVLEKVDVPPEDAMITARMLVASDLRGVDSHGVAHLKPFYVDWIRQGKVNPKPKVEIFNQTPTTAVVDGGQGLGFVAGYQAMRRAIGMAEKEGSGFVSARNSFHFGAAAYYAMMALEHDMIGVAMTVGGRLMVAPGSSKATAGLNPLAVAIPAGNKPPFVLDMSTSVIAFGKVEIALRKGLSLPEGWVVDGQGGSVTDPTQVISKIKNSDGGILPLGGLPVTGGYKGFALSVLIDILCGILSGKSAGTPATHFFGAIRIDGFLPVASFKKEMGRMIDSFGSLPTLPGVKKVCVAGEYEDEVVRDRRTNGIPLDDKVIQSLKELSQELGVTYSL